MWIFAGGLLVGGLFGYLASMFTWKKYYQKFYEAFADEEIGDMKKYYDKKLEELSKKNDPYVGAKEKKEKPNDILPTESYDSLLKPYQTASSRANINCQGVAKLSEETEKTLAEQEHPDDDDDSPKQIDELDFGIRQNYEQVEVMCYSDKKNGYKNIVLVESQHSKPIELIDIGRDNVLRAVHDDTTDVAYVRNDKLQIYYEIIIDERSYEDVGDYEEFGSDYEPEGHWEKDDDSWNV